MTCLQPSFLSSSRTLPPRKPAPPVTRILFEMIESISVLEIVSPRKRPDYLSHLFAR